MIQYKTIDTYLEAIAGIEIALFPRADDKEISENFQEYGISHQEIEDLFCNYRKFKEQIVNQIKEEGILTNYKKYIPFFQPFDGDASLVYFFSQFYIVQPKSEDEFRTMLNFFIKVVCEEFAMEDNSFESFSMTKIIQGIQALPFDNEKKWQLLNFYSLDLEQYLTIHEMIVKASKIIENNLPILNNELKEAKNDVSNPENLKRMVDDTFQSHHSRWFEEDFSVRLTIFRYNSFTIFQRDDDFYPQMIKDRINDLTVTIGFLFNKLRILKTEKYEAKKKVLNTLKALGDSTRFDIIQLLKMKKLYTQELAKLLDLTPPTVVHHLQILSNLDLVTIEVNLVDDKKIYYSTNKKQFKWIAKQILEIAGEENNGKKN